MSVDNKNTPNYNTSIPPEIMTPNEVETAIGTLKFFDGVPTRETVEMVYDNLDRMRGVEAFLNAMPGASVYALVKGQQSIGAVNNHQVVITEELMDSNPLLLTANTSTLYVVPSITTKEDGPVVMEVPPGMLGAFNDMWFRYVQDIGPAGPDRGQGGKYLLLPPGYEGDIPDGYFIVRPKTYRVWIFMRGSIAKGLDVAVKNVKDHLKIYPLSKIEDPPKMEFVNGSKQPFNTIHANNFHFYEEINDLIQEESMEMIDPETRGLLAAIGIVQGQPFNPDARMKKLLTEAVAIGNATARAIVWYPRIEGAKIYPDTDSAWMMGFAGKDVFFEREGARNLDARVMFHYPYTAVTPAMAVTRPGLGSDYGIAYLDANKHILDGSKTYRLHLPPNVPVNNFWAVTIYDSQTRSQLQTSQPFPTVGSQSENFQQNDDGSYDVYFAPEPPQGKDGNWLQTIPGKSWFIALRMYGPLEAWIDQSWRPGEIEEV
ncbi:MAG: DUF1254 domain-containing protein [Chloroflexota bacterium]|nr:MAG: DUF1254 domain-containing protein [Chloroflexota bacterium]